MSEINRISKALKGKVQFRQGTGKEIIFMLSVRDFFFLIVKVLLCSSSVMSVFCFHFGGCSVLPLSQSLVFHQSLWYIQQNNMIFCNYRAVGNDHQLHLMSACSVLPSILIAFQISKLSTFYLFSLLFTCSLFLLKTFAENRLLGHFQNFLEFYCYLSWT